MMDAKEFRAAAKGAAGKPPDHLRPPFGRSGTSLATSGTRPTGPLRATPVATVAGCTPTCTASKAISRTPATGTAARTSRRASRLSTPSGRRSPPSSLGPPPAEHPPRHRPAAARHLAPRPVSVDPPERCSARSRRGRSGWSAASRSGGHGAPRRVRHPGRQPLNVATVHGASRREEIVAGAGRDGTGESKSFTSVPARASKQSSGSRPGRAIVPVRLVKQ